MTSPKKVAVLIPSWNGRHHLKTCLEALSEQQDPGIPWEAWVLDNASSDDTTSWLGTTHPWVRMLRSEHNLGFCVGNNRLASECDADALVFLNNDTRPVSTWLQALVDALSRAPEDVVAVSGKIVDWDGQRLDFARGILTFDGHAFQLDYRRPLEIANLPADGEELLFPCGGNMITWRQPFLDSGGFDESYFAYLEDVDLGWRYWSQGSRVLFAEEAVVHHRSMASSDHLGLYNRGFLFERNALLTAYKNYEPGLWSEMMPVVLLTFLSRTKSMVAEGSPGGATICVDPFADSPRVPTTPTSAGPWQRLSRKWRQEGTLGAAKALVRRLTSRRAAVAEEIVTLSDPRSVAQLRAIHSLLSRLEASSKKRQEVQRNRRRSDREIFDRFGLYVVPTYPGDADLFSSPGFESWLPDKVPFRRALLEEVMEL